jgi:hypothetical protein
MPWGVLGIAPTADARAVRRAYARLLKTRQHEEDPDFFNRLREAYETALTLAAIRETQAEADECPSISGEAQATFDETQRTSNEAQPTFDEAQTTPGEAPAPDDEPSRETAQAAQEVSRITRTLAEVLPDAEEVSRASAEPSLASQEESCEEQFTREIDAEETVHRRAETADGAPFSAELGEAWETALARLKFLLEEAHRQFPYQYSANSSYATIEHSVRAIWENLRSYPQPESLMAREVFSERLAFLLVEYWPASAMLWSRAREFCNWHPPRFSDASPFAQALRYLFDAAEKQELSKPAAPDKAAGEAREPVTFGSVARYCWRRCKTWFLYLYLYLYHLLFYPFLLLLFLLRDLRVVLARREAPAPVSVGQAVRRFWYSLCETTMFSVRCMIGYFFFFFEWLMILSALARKILNNAPLSDIQSALLFALVIHIFIALSILPAFEHAENFKSRMFLHSRGLAGFFVLYMLLFALVAPLFAVLALALA